MRAPGALLLCLRMLLLKRFGTALALFVVLFALLFIGCLGVGGGIAGATAGRGNREAQDLDTGFQVGQQAGAEFAENYRRIIFFWALGSSSLVSFTISFCGVLPWCRRRPRPPKLPSGPDNRSRKAELLLGFALCAGVADAKEFVLRTQANVMTEITFRSNHACEDPFNGFTLDAVFLDPQGRELRVPGFWAPTSGDSN